MQTHAQIVTPNGQVIYSSPTKRPISKIDWQGIDWAEDVIQETAWGCWDWYTFRLIRDDNVVLDSRKMQHIPCVPYC